MAIANASQMTDVQELQKQLANPAGNNAYIDVRTAGEYKGGYIHGVENIPLGQIDKHVNRFQGVDAVYVHCHNGIRTKEAVKKLSNRGVNAIGVDGGIVAWKKAGLPVVQGAGGGGGVISVIRQVQITAGSLVLLGAILSKYVHPEFIWLSGVMGAGLLFTGLSGSCMMAMVLEKMPWNK